MKQTILSMRRFTLWASILLLAFTFACAPSDPAPVKSDVQNSASSSPSAKGPISATPSEKTTAKYVFLFIGDGMGAAQVQLTRLYQEVTAVSSGEMTVGFSAFPVQSTVFTGSADSLVTDSAAAGTALATGHKTRNGIIAKDATRQQNLESIAASAKKAGMKVGIVTSVSMNHATPAAFYAHQDSRNDYYAIAMQLGTSGFDYFGGGGFNRPRGPIGSDADAYDAAKKQGYLVVRDAAAVRALQPPQQNVLATYPTLLGGGEMPWAIDQSAEDLTLADFTQKGIDLLQRNRRGFFMMIEGGKIDWACHDNDATTVIHETLALDAAVKRALTFYEQHKENTLIVVTADHETGGLTLGNNTTPMALNIGLLQHQRASLGKLNQTIHDLLARQAPFEDLLALITKYTGLGSASKALTLSDADITALRLAYNNQLTPSGYGAMGNQSQLQIKARREDQLATLIIDMLNRSAGLNWGSLMHTGANVPLFAIGVGAEQFQQPLDNTDVPKKLGQLMGLSQ